MDQNSKRIVGARQVFGADAPSRARQIVLAGDILVSTVRPNLNAVAPVPNEIDRATASTGFCVLRPDSKKVVGDYLFHWVRSPRFVAEMVKRATGASYPAVSDRIVLDSRVPVPPLSGQQRIAEILDKADAVRARRRAALAQLDALTQSIFLDMFGDPVSNPRGWPRQPFGAIGENQDSQRVPVRSSDRNARRGEYPYYGASGIIDWVDDYIFDGERLLIGEDGANLLARATPVAFSAQGQYWVNNHAHVIAHNGRADLRFLEFFIEQLDLKPFVSGTAQPKLSRSSLDRISVPVPPLVLQEDFKRRAMVVDGLRTAHRSSLVTLDALFASLQHRAFSGGI